MSRTPFRNLALALTLTSLACGGGTGDITGTAPMVAVSVDVDSQATTLGTEPVHYVFHLTSVAGFRGSVAYSLDSLPSSWTLNYAQPNPVTLASGGTQDLTVSIVVPTDGDAAPAGRGLSLHMTAGTQDSRVHVVLTVANEFIVPIALGTVDQYHWGALADNFPMKVGATITFRNDDSVYHVIHTNSVILDLTMRVIPEWRLWAAPTHKHLPAQGPIGSTAMFTNHPPPECMSW